jgi:formylglycine-generating enzyme required for sulfatase activity
MGDGDNYPVYYVSWNDIVNEFLPELNRLTGKQFRLPTEAEWEYAARGGNASGGYKYSGSNNIEEVAWYYGNTEYQNPLTYNHIVGSKSPNELGIYDMSGNVWEWCSDWYGSYSSDAQVNPHGAVSGSDRVRRGGCWDCGADYCRAARRQDFDPADSNFYMGFRIVLLLE